ncbi:hypothetical protein SFRURICE_002990 [Spodoptera frugiperda]|nr:hypothetical protein SFRURICE_002990 [Spodoptera frugiperda]
MEVDLQDTFLREEDQQSQHSSKQTYSVANKRKNEKVQEEKVATEQQAKEEKEQAENIASMLIRNYDNKLYGEDDTSQPTSRTAPIIPIEATRKKKKRRRSQISICLTNCRYESIRKVASAFGMREVSEEDAWNFYWTDMSVSVERAKEMKRFQRINHFPGMLEICSFGEALNYSKSRKNKTFIIKPECGSQGRGIYLTKSLKDIKPTDKLICQVYLSKPYLVDGYKFDIRVYTLITSCDPLRIFVYNEGLVRFATSRYADPNVNNTTNVFMHLTNYALNKHSRTYVYDSEAGSKRKISTLNKILLSQGVDLDRLWHAIDQVIVKTIISAWPILKHSYHACFPSHDMVLFSFIFIFNFCRRVYPVGEQYASLFQQPSGSLYTGTASSRARGDCTRLQREEFQQTKAKAEALKKPSQPKGPKEGEKKPEEGSSTTTAITTTTITEKPSKAKARADKEQKRKDKDDKDKKLSNKPSLSQQPVSDVTLLEPKVSEWFLDDQRTPVRVVRSTASTKKVPEKEVKPTYVLCSFEPDPIVEKEERERVNLLAQRDFLIRSYGMLEQIYLVMKKMGTLRPEDERKYGVYGRLSVVSNSPKTAIKKSKTVAQRPNDNGDYSDSGLQVQCRDVVIYERPLPVLDVPERSTKAHLARTAYTIRRMSSSVIFSTY